MSAYGESALDCECADLARTTAGRNDLLYCAGRVIGQLVAAGEIGRAQAERRLFDAAMACGYVRQDGPVAARATIKSGLDHGERKPREGKRETRRSTRGPPPTLPPVKPADRSEDIAKARKRWAEAIDPRNTSVESYLRGRALDLPDDIAGTVIRLHPACPWQDDDDALICVPAMIAAMRSIATDEIIAVSRRRLTPQGEKVGKPRYLGVAAGAAIKLDADDTVTNGLHIAEGVESGHAGRMLDLKPMWCLGSKNEIANFPVLGGVECLTILAEPDAETHVKKCAERWAQAGREVRIVRPTRGKDLNDAIRGDA